MASEFSATDQSIGELTRVKLGDDTMEEEKHEPEDVSVADEINKEEEHTQVSSSSEPAVETNEGKSNDVEIFTSKELVNSAFKQEALEVAKVAQTSENEIKPESSSDKVEIELDESEDPKDVVNKLMHTEVPVVVFSNASEVPEESGVDGITESGSPEEHKPEESAEIKPVVEFIKSEDTKGEIHELVNAEISAVDSEAPAENNTDLITPTSLEAPLKDPERYAVSLEEKKPEECGETKVHVESSMSEDSKVEVHELVPVEVSINAVAPKISDVDSSTRATVEVPVKDFEVESSSPEEQKAEVGAESGVKESIKLGYSKEEAQELVSQEVPMDISESVKKNDVHLTVPTSAEVPLEDLELESGSPKEQKLEESVETKVDIELIESGESKDGQDLVSFEVLSNASEAPTSTVVPVKNLEVESSSPGEQKDEEGAETKVNIELTEPDDSEVEGQELVSAEVPVSTSEVPKINDVELSTTTSTKVPVNGFEIESGSPDERKPEEAPETVSSEVCSNNSEEFEKNDVDSSTPTSIEVPVKDLEVESEFPTEQKLEESAEIKVNIEFIKSGESKEEGRDLFSGDVSSNSSEAPKINDAKLSTPTSTEVHLKDLEVDSSSIEEQKLEESAEIESGDSKDEGHESVSSKVLTNTSEDPENNNVDSSSSTSIEVPAKDLEVESGSSEEQKIEEISETKVDIKLVESGDSKVESQESVSDEVPVSTSEEPEDNNIDLSTPTGIEVPVKDLEVESGFPEEQQIEESTETKVNTDFVKSVKSKDEGQASGEVPTSSSQAPEINDVDLSIPASTEVTVKDLGVESGSPEEQKSEEGPETKVNVKLTESGDSEVEGQESVSIEVPASISDESEDINTDLSTPTGIEVPVKDLEVQSGSPEEQKIEESAETKVSTDFIKSAESKDEGQASGEVPTSSSQTPEINDVYFSIPASTEVPVKDLGVESGSPEEQKPEEGAETKVNVKLTESGDSEVEGQESVSIEVPASISEEYEDINTELSTPTGIEVPVKDLEVQSGSPEEQKIEESAETKVNTDFNKSAESKDEGQASGEVPTSSSQTPEISDIDSPITEVPVKDLGVESGYPEEQKPEEGAETKVNIKLTESGDSEFDGQESVSAEVPASISEKPEDSVTYLSTPTGIEVPVKDLEVESGDPEEKKFEGSAELKVITEFNKSGESKDEGQDLVPGEVPTNTSEAPEITSVDLTAPTSTHLPVKGLEVESGFPEEQKPEVNIELLESGDSKVEGQEFVSAEVPDNTCNAPEKKDAELSTPTSMEVSLKDLEVTSGSPEEQKLEESAKTNVDIESIKLGDSKSVFAEGTTNASEEHQHNNVNFTSRTGMEVPMKDLEVESGSAEKQNPKDNVETKEPISDVTTIDGGGEVTGSYSHEDKSSGVGEVADKEVEGFKEDVIQIGIEEDQTFSNEDKVSQAVAVKKGVEIIKDDREVVEERKEWTSEFDNSDTVPKVSEVSLAGRNVLEDIVNVEAIERDLGETSIDSTAARVSTGQEKIPETVEIEPLELKFEQIDVSPETSEVLSAGERVSAVDEKSESSKGEERKDETSEVDNTNTTNASVVSTTGGIVLAKDLNIVAKETDLAEASINSTVGGVSTEQAKIPENAEVKPLELKFGDLSVSPEASEVPSVEEKVSAGDERSESSKGRETKDETFEADNTVSTPNVSEVLSAVGKVLEKDVNVEAIERDLAETAIDSTVYKDSPEQAKIPEYVQKFEELNPEASQVPSMGEGVSAGDGKSEDSKDETGTSLVETPKDIVTSDVPLAHSVEKTENESSKSLAEAAVEQFPEAVKEIIASESYNEKKDETSRDVSLEEKNANANQDKKSEVKVKGVIENAPGPEELEIEKREGEKPKDDELIVSSDTRDVKLIKEVTKRESNIFAKMKRSIIKAKKAILGKSPGPKTVSSESKDENN